MALYPQFVLDVKPSKKKLFKLRLQLVMGHCLGMMNIQFIVADRVYD